jgi:cell wall-associated NlpC family hydrolase
MGTMTRQAASSSARQLARRLVTAVLLLGGLTFSATASAALTSANWDPGSQRAVLRAGLMRDLGGSFNGAAGLTAAQANQAMIAFAAAAQSPYGATSAAAPAVRATRSPVMLQAFDRMLVAQLGLADVAAHVQAATSAAGLNPPGYYGTEVVARYLGLRYNHPSSSDQLELFPTDPITRAEAAWSLARALNFGSWNTQDARQTLTGYGLPALGSNELQALRIAVSRIGYPYVWGGTADDTSDGLAHGGFDCSGFVWRVFKVSGLSWGRRIGGRTAAQQAGEIPRSQRLHASALQPGDTLFFGSAHFNSTATEANVIHEGIYLGDNWVIHSSGQGVYVLPLRGSWLGDQFAWGRRVIY